MDEAELLLTIAEISVAFAGFASLASIFGRRSGRDDARVDSGRLLNMLTTSLTVTALSLIPFVPILLALPDRWVWGISGAVGIVLTLVFGPSVLRRVSHMQRYPGFNQASKNWNFVFAAVALVALACCVAGIPAEKLFAAYFGGLLALLVVCGSLFVSVIASLARAFGQD